MTESVQKTNKIAALYPLTKFYIAIAIAATAVILPGIKLKAICFVAVNILSAASGVYGVFLRRVKNSVGVLFIILVLQQVIRFFFHSGYLPQNLKDYFLH